MTRINCHSAFKHYEMFHSRRGDVVNIGSNNTTIFNFGGWGGRTFGGFWGGFGFGLGNALGGLFSGFGGLGMGGWGFPSLGWSGSGLFSPLGLSGRRVSRSGDSCHCQEKTETPKTTTSSTTTGESEKLDPDRKAIGELWDRKHELLKKGAQPTSTDLQKLLDDINAAEKNQDKNPVHDTTDNADFARLKYGLEDAIAAAKEREAKAADGNGSVEAPEVSDTEKTGKTSPEEPTVTIGGKQVKLSDLTPEQIKGLTAEQIAALTPEQAKALLEKLGLLNDDKNGVKATTNLAALLLTQKSGLPLSCGHNTALDNIENSDPYINGKISDVALDKATNTISFVIDDDNAKYKMSCKPDDTKYQIEAMVENKTHKYETVKAGTEYEIIEDDNDDYAVRNGEAAIE